MRFLPRRRVQLVAGGLLVVAVAAWLSSPRAMLARLDWLAADPLRFGVAVVALAAVRPVFAWPTTLVAVAVGYGYGYVGFPVALALVVLTSVPPYLLGRRASGGGPVAETGARFVAETGDFRVVAASRLVPAPSDVVSVAAGVADVGLLGFLAGTAVGEVPWVAAGVVAGRSMDALATGGVTDVFDPRLVVAAASVGVLALAGPLYRLVGTRRAERS